MEEAQTHLAETLSHLQHEEEENPAETQAEHEEHRARLAEQAAGLHGRLSLLAEAADTSADTHGEDHFRVTSGELQRMRQEVAESKVYTEAQREQVLSNLHAMGRSVERLSNETIAAGTAANLKDALRIRLSILSDNVRGFVTAGDIDRRDRYGSIQTLLADVANASSKLPAAIAAHLNASVARLGATVDTLSGGLMGSKRQQVDNRPLRTNCRATTY